MKLLQSIFMGLFVVFITTYAWAKPLTINLGYTGAEGSAYGQLASKFAELAEEYGNGDIKVKIRCCAQYVTEDEAFKAMQLGTVDMYIITDANIAPHFPMMNAFVLPYIFQSYEHSAKVLEGPIGKKIADKLQEETGVTLLTYGGVAYRDFYNSIHPINSMKDLKGIKIRVPKNDVMIATWKAFGAAPIPLAWAETPPALQTGTVDGGDNGTSFIKSQKFYEICKNLAILDHFGYVSPIFASKRIMSKMSDSQRDIIWRAAKDAGAYHRDLMNAELKELRQWLVNEGGMEITYPDKKEFVDVALKVQDDFAANMGEEFKKTLQEIRDAAQ